MKDLQIGFGKKKPALKLVESSGGMGLKKSNIMANRKPSEPPVPDTPIKVPEFKKVKILEAVKRILKNLFGQAK